MRTIRHVFAKSNQKKLIIGVTKKKGTPIASSVKIYCRLTGRLLSSAKSSENNGVYVLFGGQNNANYVVAIDLDREFNLAAQDNVI